MNMMNAKARHEISTLVINPTKALQGYVMKIFQGERRH